MMFGMKDDDIFNCSLSGWRDIALLCFAESCAIWMVLAIIVAVHKGNYGDVVQALGMLVAGWGILMAMFIINKKYLGG